MAVIMVYKRRECRIMLVFHWLLHILLKCTVFILSLCVGLLTNNFLLLFTSQLHVQYKTLVFRCKQKGSVYINPLKPELNPICYLLALLGAHHFLHVSRIRVKLLTFRLLMSYIYMEHPFLMFLDHTQ